MTSRSRVGITLVFLGAASAAAAAGPQEGGGSLFKTYCASCHGPEAKGDGPRGARGAKIQRPGRQLVAKQEKRPAPPRAVRL